MTEFRSPRKDMTELGSPRKKSNSGMRKKPDLNSPRLRITEEFRPELRKKDEGIPKGSLTAQKKKKKTSG